MTTAEEIQLLSTQFVEKMKQAKEALQVSGIEKLRMLTEESKVAALYACAAQLAEFNQMVREAMNAEKA